jgi:hypothetical protein
MGGGQANRPGDHRVKARKRSPRRRDGDEERARASRHRSHPFSLTQHWLFSGVAAFFCLRDG